MKRICKIQLENSRAYYNPILFSLPKGENLLLYGENGSGKTSLYRALDDILRSFIEPVCFTSNRYKPEGAFAEVRLSIGEYDPARNSVIDAIDYTFAPGIDNTTVGNTAFLKALAHSKGFLNYKDLLKVYLYDEKNPNLFDFFINHLLGNHLPLAQGLHNPLAKEWNELKNDIYEVYNRNDRRHRRGKRRLYEYEVVLRSVLRNLIAVVNNYLSTYFTDFGLRIDFELKPMNLYYGRRKREWTIEQDLRLKVIFGNIQVEAYTEGLNEARLSAIAICLYLASLRASPGAGFSVMFLDDIFIGIDSVNRLPILKILNNEFVDFQIIIATYDRSWYCMAKKFLESNNPKVWKFANLYALPKTVNDKSFDEPILVDGDTNFDQARKYLHDGRNINLPAAANFFRKALEELFELLPKELYTEDDFTFLPGFQITQRAAEVSKLFERIDEETQYINGLRSFLHTLIHPLSHFEEEAPVYRNELIEVERAISSLKIQIENFPKRCVLLLGKGNKLAVHYDTPDGNYRVLYHIILEDNIWLFKDSEGNSKITDCRCRTFYIEEWSDEGYKKKGIPKNALRFSYSSLDKGLKAIYDYLVNENHHNVTPHNGYDIVEILNNGKRLGARIEESLEKM